MVHSIWNLSLSLTHTHTDTLAESRCWRLRSLCSNVKRICKIATSKTDTRISPLKKDRVLTFRTVSSHLYCMGYQYMLLHNINTNCIFNTTLWICQTFHVLIYIFPAFSYVCSSHSHQIIILSPAHRPIPDVPGLTTYFSWLSVGHSRLQKGSLPWLWHLGVSPDCTCTTQVLWTRSGQTAHRKPPTQVIVADRKRGRQDEMRWNTPKQYQRLTDKKYNYLKRPKTGRNKLFPRK